MLRMIPIWIGYMRGQSPVGKITGYRVGKAAMADMGIRPRLVGVAGVNQHESVCAGKQRGKVALEDAVFHQVIDNVDG